MAELEYPRLVYKPGAEGVGNAQPVWNIGYFEVRQVEDATELAEAVSDGWLQSPDEKPAEAKPAKGSKTASD